MSGSQLKIKQRIRSIQGTQKITKAMELIANAKLAKARKDGGQSNVYQDALIDMCATVARHIDGQSIYTLDNGRAKLVVVLGSDLGLCGGYTNALVDKVKNTIKKDRPLWLIGTKGSSIYRHLGYTMFDEPISIDRVEKDHFDTVGQTILDAFLDQRIGGVTIIYNRFINALQFTTESIDLLPFVLQSSDPSSSYCEFEPDGRTILDTLIPKMVKANGYHYLKSARLSEYAARRAAMENANTNADTLIEQLRLAYNQARQASITTQIAEIVGGSDAIR